VNETDNYLGAKLPPFSETPEESVLNCYDNAPLRASFRALYTALPIGNRRSCFVCPPGGMYNGMLIQNLDIKDVSSERRNPILANVMAQLDYMEKRGSGLTRICNETK